MWPAIPSPLSISTPDTILLLTHAQFQALLVSNWASVSLEAQGKV